MSRREEAIVIDDSSSSDSETECKAAAPKRRAPVTRSSAKKARQAQVPKTDTEADALVRAAIDAAAPLCKACLCRDRAHKLVDGFLCLLTSVPELATIEYSEDDGGMQIEPLPIRSSADPPAPLLDVAVGIVTELQLLDNNTMRGLSSRHFRDPVRLCNASVAGRAASAHACTGLLRHAVADTLVQLPHVIVDIIASFIDAVHDYVDRPLLRHVYTVYVRSIRTFLENQQAALRAMETSSDAHRISFDERRIALMSNVAAVAEIARSLRWNHANGRRVAAFGQDLHDRVRNLTTAAHCFHSVSQADAAREAMTRRWNEVESEVLRLARLGFRVHAQYLY